MERISVGIGTMDRERERCRDTEVKIIYEFSKKNHLLKYENPLHCEFHWKHNTTGDRGSETN